MSIFIKIPPVYWNELRQDYLNFGLTYFYENVFRNGFDEWSKGDIFGIKQANYWKFYEGRLALKGTFPIELVNVSNQSEVIGAPTNLEIFLAGRKTEIEK